MCDVIILLSSSVIIPNYFIILGAVFFSLSLNISCAIIVGACDRQEYT